MGVDGFFGDSHRFTGGNVNRGKMQLGKQRGKSALFRFFSSRCRMPSSRETSRKYRKRPEAFCWSFVAVAEWQSSRTGAQGRYKHQSPSGGIPCENLISGAYPRTMRGGKVRNSLLLLRNENSHCFNRSGRPCRCKRASPRMKEPRHFAEGLHHSARNFICN